MVALAQVVPVKHMMLYDICPAFIEHLQKCWPGPCTMAAEVLDLRRIVIQPEADIVLFGVIPYIFDDEDLSIWLHRHRRNRILVRTPCSLAERGVIDKISLELGGDRYAACYRTCQETEALLGVHHTIADSGECWPAEIDSRFGTRQHVYELCPRAVPE